MLFVLLGCLAEICFGFPSGNIFPPEFEMKEGDWYDSWGFNRNYYGGDNGFIPNVAYESLGSNKDRAYSLGIWFKEVYEQKVTRAEAILDYVQRWTDYGFDEDNVYMNNIAQIEWAWNADEMALAINETIDLVAVGDCEDMAFLGATLYIAAGYDVALVLPPEHVALLIWLPEYDNANYYWDIPNDGREYGWIWVEATGEANPLGWTPPDFSDGEWPTFPLGFSKFTMNISPSNPNQDEDVLVRASIVSERGQINQVLMNYSINNSYKVVQMNSKGSNFEAIIPKQPDETTVVFQISAFDTEGFIREEDFEYIVGQQIQLPPFLLEAAGIFFVILFIAALAFRRR